MVVVVVFVVWKVVFGLFLKIFLFVMMVDVMVVDLFSMIGGIVVVSDVMVGGIIVSNVFLI